MAFLDPIYALPTPQKVILGVLPLVAVGALGVSAEVPIAMTAGAGYPQLGAFFDRVARLPRVVTLGDFKVSGISRPTGTIRAEMTLATYVFRAEGAPGPGKPGAPAKPAAGAAPAAPPPPAAPRPGARP